ncbi:MAG: Uma2 family endonuclease [Deltaproteobacteria bacterium]|nr:Uma2 family endonuclease [Deltaproteobacteria bacterium]
MNVPNRMGRGPFTVNQVEPGDRYELSEGHAIYCAPAGGDHAKASSIGALVIDSDPAVESTGIDAGYAFATDTMRAPDISVGVPDKPGWVEGVPPLAIEYAAKGQDDDQLKAKIREFLAAGTKWIWIVRLTVPRHVEVHEKGRRMKRKHPGDYLEAPGVLKNSVPVEALFDRRVAQEVTLDNLLERKGYSSLEEVISKAKEAGQLEGKLEGKLEGALDGLRTAIIAVLESRGVAVSAKLRTRVLTEASSEQLEAWVRRAALVDRAEASRPVTALGALSHRT